MISNTGYTIYKSTGITIEYTHVDLEKSRVTADILYKKQVNVTVVIDVDSGTTHKKGDFTEILKTLPSEDENPYIEQIKDWAEIFIRDKINNPSEYFESLLDKETKFN